MKYLSLIEYQPAVDMVKLTLDQLVVKYMPFNMNNASAKEPILKIVLGEFEVTTSR